MMGPLARTLANIPRRARTATAYSLAGLKSGLAREEAIRLEALALAALVAVMFFVPWPAWKKLAQVAAFLLIPVAELLNSAIEEVCDLITTEHNEHIKRAKDYGSAAVFLALVFNLFVLAALLCL